MKKEDLIKKVEDLRVEDFARHDYEFLISINPGDETPILQDQIDNWKNDSTKIETFKEIMIELIKTFHFKEA